MMNYGFIQTNGSALRRPTESEWQALKPVLRALYLEQHRPLHAVERTLRAQGLDVTQRTIRARLRRWNMLRRDQPAAGIDSFIPRNLEERPFTPQDRMDSSVLDEDMFNMFIEAGSSELFQSLSDCNSQLGGSDLAEPTSHLPDAAPLPESHHTRPNGINDRTSLLYLTHRQRSGGAAMNSESNSTRLDGPTGADDLNQVLRRSLGGSYLLHAAAQHGRLQLVEEFLRDYAVDALDPSGVTPLWLAAANGHPRIVARLLAAKANPNAAARNSGRLPLHEAAFKGHQEIVTFLLPYIGEEEIDLPDVAGETPLFLAAQSGDYEIVHLLLKKGANLEGSPVSASRPLHQAAKNGHGAVLKLLIDKGAEVDPISKEGYTPLWLVAEQGDTESVKLLLDKGANPNVLTGKDGYQPLHLATKAEDMTMFKDLLDVMSEIDVPGNDGTTALWHAACRCQKYFATVLLDRGADANVAHRKNKRTPLHQAAQSGDSMLCELLLSKGAKIDAPEEDGVPALWLAAQDGKFNVVKALLDAGANPDLYDYRTRRQAIHQAAQNGHSKVVSLLLQHPCEPDNPASDGVTPLGLAAQKGVRASVRALLDRGVDRNSRFCEGTTPLFAAVLNCFPEIVHMLLEDGADANAMARNGGTPLTIAANHGDTATVRMLLAKGANPTLPATAQRTTALHVAAHCGHHDIVKLLIEYKAEINVQDVRLRTPLVLATSIGRTKIVQTLINHGADPTIKTSTGRQALHYAAQDGYTEIVKILSGVLEKRIDEPDSTKVTPLFLAASVGHERISSILLDQGADPNFRNNQHRTPLHFAVESGSQKVVTLLLKRGAEPNASTVRSVTPLYLAAAEGHVKIVESLLAHGADPNIIEATNGRHPLHGAAVSSSSAVVSFLLRHSSAPDQTLDQRDRFGNTPLLIASHSGDKTSVAALLLGGANPNLPEVTKSRSPLHYAARNGHSEIVDLLLRHGAETDPLDDKGITPLIFAAREGHLQVVKQLQRAKADLEIRVFKDDGQALHQAIMKGHRDVARFLIGEMKDVDVRMNDGRTPLWLASQIGDTGAVGELLARDADPNVFAQKTRRHVIHEAASNGHLEITAWLLDIVDDVDVEDEKGMTPLLLATERGDGATNLIEAILDHNADPNASSITSAQTPLHVASQHGGLGIITMLIKRSAEVDARMEDGETPVFLAAQRGDLAAVKILLENGADIDISTDASMRPLHVAAKGGHTEVVSVLLAGTSEINHVTDDGETPLSLAVSAGDKDSTTTLLDRGANPDTMDKKTGFHMLHIAAQFEDHEILQALLKKGAHTNKQVNDGVTPLIIASQNDRLTAVELLLEHGAEITYRDSSGIDALTHAVMKGHDDIIKVLARAKAQHL